MEPNNQIQNHKDQQNSPQLTFQKLEDNTTVVKKENEENNNTEKAQFFPSKTYQPGQFEPSDHYYPRVLNAQIHSTVYTFLTLTNKQIAARFCHTRPEFDQDELLSLLNDYIPKHLLWSGSDLMYVSERESGKSYFTVIETNSCASGQKSSPLYDENEEDGGYGKLLRKCFLPEMQRRQKLGVLPKGDLAVIYDKNVMEVTGYAAALADITGEQVHLIPAWSNEQKYGNKIYKFENDILYTRKPTKNPCVVDQEWIPIRAAFRYVTQQPWKKIPVNLPITGTFIVNPIISCLGGGRNKLVAAKAYDNFSIELEALGLPKIRTPLTIRDVEYKDLRKWVKKLGGIACIKAPYSNGGQGVYTITNEEEMLDFEQCEKGNHYCLFIVQTLIANSKWSSKSSSGGTLYHNGTIPNKKGEIYVCDLRVQVCGNSETGGFRPVALYARKTKKPLVDTLPAPEGVTSWDMLGTNLTQVKGNEQFTSESSRLLLMDRKDFNSLGISLDSLIDAFIQSVFAHIAVDRMSDFLCPNGEFSESFFQAVCDDKKLVEEIKEGISLNKKLQ